MHATHQRVARAAIGKAMEALAAVDAAEIPASSAARLIEIGTRLERDTLTVSVEELQGGLAGGQPDDPFEAIARELTGGSIDPD